MGPITSVASYRNSWPSIDERDGSFQGEDVVGAAEDETVIEKSNRMIVSILVADDGLQNRPVLNCDYTTDFFC